MRVDVIMPQMGESIAEGTITRWMKQVGDTVERDEPIFEISTDKVDAEIPAPSAGTEEGASGSGRLCHACILGGTPVLASSTVAVTRPEATGPSGAPERPPSSIRGGSDEPRARPPRPWSS